MVGVPGKSKGCHTCRRRRVKCDATVPNCQRCVRSGRECEGYAKAPVFLNRTAQGLEKRKFLEEVRPRDGSTSSNLPANSETEPGSSAALPSSSGSDTCPSERDPLPSTAGAEEMALPTLMTVKNELLDEFLPECDPCFSMIGQWLLQALAFDHWSELLWTSFMALTCVRMARRYSDTKLLVEGMAKYGYALKLLQEAINDAEDSRTAQTLAACQLLKLFEVCEATGDDIQSFDGHTAGSVQLIIHQGITNDPSMPGAVAIWDIRYDAMMTALRTRKRGTLQRCGWLDASMKSATDCHQALLDIGLDIAAAMEAADAVRDSRQVPTATMIRYDLRLATIGRALMTWNLAASNVTGILPNLTGALPKHPVWRWETSKEPDTLPIDTSRLVQSTLMIDFWMLQLIIGLEMRRFRSKVKHADPATTHEGDVYMDSDFQLRIAHAMMHQGIYQARKKHGLLLISRLIFPTRIAKYITKIYSSRSAVSLRNTVDRMQSLLAERFSLAQMRVLANVEDEWGELPMPLPAPQPGKVVGADDMDFGL